MDKRLSYGLKSGGAIAEADVLYGRNGYTTRFKLRPEPDPRDSHPTTGLAKRQLDSLLGIRF